MIDDTCDLGGPDSQLVLTGMWKDNTEEFCRLFVEKLFAPEPPPPPAPISPRPAQWRD